VALAPEAGETGTEQTHGEEIRCGSIFTPEISLASMFKSQMAKWLMGIIPLGC
jgi:hypothetical protein